MISVSCKENFHKFILWCLWFLCVLKMIAFGVGLESWLGICIVRKYNYSRKHKGWALGVCALGEEPSSSSLPQPWVFFWLPGPVPPVHLRRPLDAFINVLRSSVWASPESLSDDCWCRHDGCPLLWTLVSLGCLCLSIYRLHLFSGLTSEQQDIVGTHNWEVHTVYKWLCTEWEWTIELYHKSEMLETKQTWNLKLRRAGLSVLLLWT